MKNTFTKTLIVTFTFFATLSLTGCFNESTTSDLPISKGQQVEEERITIDKTIPSPQRIKIAEILPSASNSEYWIIYLLPATVEFESRNPHQFRCQVRIVTAEDDAVPAIELTPRTTTYEFFENGGEIYFRSINNQFGWKQSGKVKGSDFAERIYSYVVKNM